MGQGEISLLNLDINSKFHSFFVHHIPSRSFLLRDSGF